MLRSAGRGGDQRAVCPSGGWSHEQTGKYPQDLRKSSGSVRMSRMSLVRTSIESHVRPSHMSARR